MFVRLPFVCLSLTHTLNPFMSFYPFPSLSFNKHFPCTGFQIIMRTIEPIREYMEPETVAAKCLGRKMISARVEKHIRTRQSSQGDYLANSLLIDKLRGTGLDGYVFFKEILGEMGDMAHKELLRKINLKEDAILTREQLRAIRPDMSGVRGATASSK